MLHAAKRLQITLCDLYTTGRESSSI